MHRRGVLFVLPALLTAGLIAPAGTVASAAPVPSSAAADPGGAAASARASGQRVEAVSLRSEDRQVYANPDGTWTAEVTSGPVRVHQPDGSWSPVDTTLRRLPDGSVAPVAAVAGVVLSGGGTAPLVRLTHGSRGIALGWSAPLPVPALDGDTATYAEVLPGVDLQVSAQVSGFAERLVVKSAQAAANPALVKITFPLITTGVSVRADTDGAMQAVDGAGRPVFEAPRPVMWDSPPAAPPAGIAVPESGGNTAVERQERPMAVALTSTSLTLTPDRGC